MGPLIDILLSTYNGEKYLKDQLDSIVRQSVQDWRIIVRDDGSTDSTLTGVLKQYQELLGDKLRVLSGENVGVVGSFSRLMDQSSAPYLMFCDQDDVWFNDKVEVMLQSIKTVEQSLGSNIPVLSFSNLALVDQDGRPTGSDFWRFHGINPHHSSLERLLLQNVVTGCACMFNRALLVISTPIPHEAILHDWWLSLNASLFGVLAVVDRPTIYYRQHSSNQVGARGISYRRLRKMIGAEESVGARLAGIIKRTATQATALLSRHSASLAPKQKRLLEGYVSLPDLNALDRKVFMLREGVLFTSSIRNICLMLF